MVTKERLGGFIDAIVAVVMTIMLLEFHIPDDGDIAEFFKVNAVYLVTYLLSFIYVITSWFNQQFMLRHVKVVTRRMYLSTMLWILALSALPVLAAWTGHTMDIFDHAGLHSPKAPALCFIVMIFLWGISYAHMSKVYIKDNPGEKGDIIRQMEVLQYLTHPVWIASMIIAGIITFFWPPFVFIYTCFEMAWALTRSRNTSETPRNAEPPHTGETASTI